MKDGAKIIDRFLNGWSPAKDRAEKPKVTIEQLISRQRSHVVVDGKLYLVTVEEVNLSKLDKKG